MSFKKLKYTTHYLVVEDEYLAVFFTLVSPVACVTHFCMLHRQEELTHAFIH